MTDPNLRATNINISDGAYPYTSPVYFSMDPNSYTNADPSPNPPKLGQYWDPLGEYENHDTIYTLLVYTPPRPPPLYVPKFLLRDATPASRIHVIREPDNPPNYDCFERRHLDGMSAKIVKIKSHYFPAEMRCKHIYGINEKKCEQGCYFLEKGGDLRRWTCKSALCEGHVYSDKVKGEEGVACFGKKGKRMVCVER